MLVNGTPYRTVWFEDGKVKIIDQSLVPHKFEILTLDNHKQTAEAITTMRVRGAGAIGATAAYAMAQAALEAPADNLDDYIKEAASLLKNTRPTAQNLFFAVERVLAVINNEQAPEEKRKAALKEAQKIADEDAASCKRIGEHGEKLIENGMKIGTHCNAGWLAFVDWGTALSPVYAAVRNGKEVFVYVDETRPRGQGSRLTAWELQQENIPFKIISDNTAGFLMQKGGMDMFITGADRIAANGDVANKIGTYEKAVVAKENNIPFYIAAPTTTIDLNCLRGQDIPIEERNQDEVLFALGRDEDGSLRKVRMAPAESQALNLAFDVTPAKYVKGIITEKGIVEASEKGIRSLFE